MRPDFVGLGGFDSHTFPPRTRWWLLALCVAALAHGAGAQAKVPVPVIKPPLSPRNAFLASAVFPGLGQAVLNRSTGLLFASVEVIGLAMYGKASHDLQVARAFVNDSSPASYVTDPTTGLPVRNATTQQLEVATWSTSSYSTDRVHARIVHREDYVALLIFNHLFAAVDAYVAAQLWDLPSRVQLRAMPRGFAFSADFHW